MKSMRSIATIILAALTLSSCGKISDRQIDHSKKYGTNGKYVKCDSSFILFRTEYGPNIFGTPVPYSNYLDKVYRNNNSVQNMTYVDLSGNDLQVDFIRYNIETPSGIREFITSNPETLAVEQKNFEYFLSILNSNPAVPNKYISLKK